MTNTRQSAMETATMRSVVPAARIAGLVTTEAGDEVLVYDQEKHHIHHLNRTSALIWRLCDGRRNVEELALAAEIEAGQSVDVIAVRMAVSKLSDAGLLVQPVADAVRTSAQSRRTFMKRSAVAGAIAVPAIVSMTAPAAAAPPSNSCGRSCSANSQCSGKCCSQCGPYTGPGYDGTYCLSANGVPFNDC